MATARRLKDALRGGLLPRATLVASPLRLPWATAMTALWALRTVPPLATGTRSKDVQSGGLSGGWLGRKATSLRPPATVVRPAGEGVAFGREVTVEGRTLCRGCAGERYYEPA